MMAPSVVPRQVYFSEKKEEKQFLHEYLVTGEFNIRFFFFFPLKLFPFF